MILGEAIEFLRETLPFNALDHTALSEITGRILLEFHPAGAVILQQDGPAAGYLYLIRKGEVKVFLRTGEDEEVLVDHLGEGEVFGFLSLVTGTVSRDSVVATKDTECYLIGREIVLRLIETNAAFSSFYLKTFLRKVVGMIYREMHDRSLLYGGGDKLLFTVTLGDLVPHRVLTASEDVSIQTAAAEMAQHKASSIVLLDSDGFPSGILTDMDLRNKVAAKGRDTSEPVSNIMSATLIKSESRDYCFEALLKMVRYNVHHLLVIDKGEIRGVLTSHDLMMLQGISPLSIAREIENQGTIDGLVPVSRKINKIITVLIKEGARAANITRIISEVNDRLVRKALEIAERKFGPPPVPYCWVVFGSEGRKEQTFKTDQDNAIICADPAPGEEKAAEDYFTGFASFMNEALAKCGFPPCPAGYMASNPRWRRPLDAWKNYFSEWISVPTPEAVLFSLIFFDFRPVHGDFTLAEKLRAYLGHALKNENRFLINMAAQILRNRPPLSIWGNIAVEKGGKHKDAFDIKMKGLSPIVDAARHSALQKGVYLTSTVDRLKELKGRQSMISEFCDELTHVFEFLMALRLRHQLGQIEAGSIPDNFIRPDALDNLDRKVLEESFKVISRVQKSISMNYNIVV